MAGYPIVPLLFALAATELAIAGLALLVSRAPKWEHLRLFSGIAASTGVYTLGDSLGLWPGASTELIFVWTGKVNYTLAGLHSALWLYYVWPLYGRVTPRYVRYYSAACVGLSLLIWVPGLLLEPHLAFALTPWGPRHYTALTPLGLAVALPWLIGFAFVMGRHIAEVLGGSRSALPHAASFGFFTLTAIHELVVVARDDGSISTMYLGMLGLLVTTLVTAAARIVQDAHALERISETLSSQVEAKSRELVDARDQLLRTERLKALGVLASSVGHEINNPLAVIRTTFDWLQHELKDSTDPEIGRALEDGLASTERAASIVRDLTVFGRGGDTSVRTLELDKLVDTALRLVGNELRHRARVVWVPSGSLRVRADEKRLMQVLVNVLVNAAHAIPDDEAGKESAVITVSTRADGDSVALTVDDTGVGISEETRKHLFEPFFTTKSMGQGTGLGLYVSLGIMRSMGGSLALLDNPSGRGTRAELRLERARETMVAQPEVAPSVGGGELSVLVIDDDEAVARSFVRMLRGFRVETVTSSPAALELLLARGEEFDVIVCDIMMPELSGFELFDAVRERRPKLEGRFLFTSGGAMSRAAVAFTRGHEERFVEKPISSQKLIERVRKAAQRPTAA